MDFMGNKSEFTKFGCYIVYNIVIILSYHFQYFRQLEIKLLITGGVDYNNNLIVTKLK
jgi:hypothetical protein